MLKRLEQTPRSTQANDRDRMVALRSKREWLRQ